MIRNDHEELIGQLDNATIISLASHHRKTVTPVTSDSPGTMQCNAMLVCKISFYRDVYLLSTSKRVSRSLRVSAASYVSWKLPSSAVAMSNINDPSNLSSISIASSLKAIGGLQMASIAPLVRFLRAAIDMSICVSVRTSVGLRHSICSLQS
jgi:hypothetical protein